MKYLFFFRYLLRVVLLGGSKCTLEHNNLVILPVTFLPFLLFFNPAECPNKLNDGIGKELHTEMRALSAAATLL